MQNDVNDFYSCKLQIVHVINEQFRAVARRVERTLRSNIFVLIHRATSSRSILRSYQQFQLTVSIPYLLENFIFRQCKMSYRGSAPIIPFSTTLIRIAKLFPDESLRRIRPIFINLYTPDAKIMFYNIVQLGILHNSMTKYFLDAL